MSVCEFGKKFYDTRLAYTVQISLWYEQFFSVLRFNIFNPKVIIISRKKCLQNK